jgi:two-component system phosphate regulon response regulator PhoB
MKKILVVDDHPDLRMLVRMTLELDEFEVSEAVNAVAAMQSIRTAPPDLVLLDIMMPGEYNGLELCRRLKSDPALRKIRVILLTARGLQADQDAGKVAGADHFLVKPFSPMQLIDTVRSMCDGIEPNTSR